MTERVDSHNMKEDSLLDRNEVPQPALERSHQLKVNRPRDGKVVCDVKCSVINVGEIDTKKQQFQADIFLSFKWKEPRFDGRKLEDIKDNEFWDPRVYIANAVAIDKSELKNDVHNHPIGENELPCAAYAYLSLRLKGTFKIAMKLEKFPFDYQELAIKVTSSWRKESIDFKRRLTRGGMIVDNIYLDTFSEYHEWDLQEHVACPEDTFMDSTESTTQKPLIDSSVPIQSIETSCKGVYPTYYIRLHAQRRSSYFVWNVIVPMICILALSFTTFSIEADAPSDRLSVTVTMLLTAVAFKFAVSSMLPRISYLTFLDYWILCNFGLQCLIVAQNAIIGASCWNDKTRNFSDLVSGIALGIMALVLNIAFIGIGRYQFITAKKTVTKITEEYRSRKAKYCHGSDGNNEQKDENS